MCKAWTIVLQPEPALNFSAYLSPIYLLRSLVFMVLFNNVSHQTFDTVTEQLNSSINGLHPLILAGSGTRSWVGGLLKLISSSHWVKDTQQWLPVHQRLRLNYTQYSRFQYNGADHKSTLQFC
ncbi:hypothetical protein XENOCAPTIV_030008 [Xenoophorus captivus]|uniref:Uncharacterized protein n=1 Tax=Xenoophorus captivus TaxID=1517983 RepID=A0ABV0QCF7_9TELE